MKLNPLHLFPLSTWMMLTIDSVGLCSMFFKGSNFNLLQFFSFIKNFIFIIYLIFHGGGYVVNSIEIMVTVHKIASIFRQPGMLIIITTWFYLSKEPICHLQLKCWRFFFCFFICLHLAARNKLGCECSGNMIFFWKI